METLAAVILILVLFLLLAGGVWIGLALAGVAWVAMELFSNRAAGDAMAITIWGASSSWTLTALPLFIWMGEILFRTRLSQDMFRGLAPWVEPLPGRLLHTNVLGCTLFAAVSGSSAATCATIGKMTLPELKARGYPDGMVIGTLAGAGTLGLLIPPSIIMIVYGVAAEVSISKLFIAGVIPGLLLAALFSGYIMLWSLWHRTSIPAAREAPDWRTRLREARSLFPVVGLILVVLGSIYGGIATATEAARRRRGRRPHPLGPARHTQLGELSRQPHGRHPYVLHDRPDPRRGCLPDPGHGLPRSATATGRIHPGSGDSPSSRSSSPWQPSSSCSAVSSTASR